jgi:AmiR/NasT family two-component response regulator
LKRVTIRSLRRSRLVLFHPKDAEGDLLLARLKRLIPHSEMNWPLPERLPATADIVMALTDAPEHHQPDWLQGYDGVLVMIVDSEKPAVLDALLAAGAHGIVTKPIRPKGVAAVLAVAVAIHSHIARLQGKVQHLEENLRARRVIEKAARILVTRKGITEDQAYEVMRRRAMDKRISVEALAGCVISAAHEADLP